VFRSLARGESGEGSYLDLSVEFEKSRSPLVSVELNLRIYLESA